MKGDNFNPHYAVKRDRSPEYRVYCLARRAIRKDVEAKVKAAFGCEITGSRGWFDHRTYTLDAYSIEVYFSMKDARGMVRWTSYDSFPRAGFWKPERLWVEDFETADIIFAEFYGAWDHVGTDQIGFHCRDKLKAFALIVGLQRLGMWKDQYFFDPGMTLRPSGHDLMEGSLHLREIAIYPEKVA